MWCLPSSFVALAALALASTSLADGLPRKGTLGVPFAPLPEDVRQKDHLNPGEGVIAREPLPGLAGAQAGIKAGDVLVDVNDKPVVVSTLAEMIRGLTVGEPVKLKVLRDGKELELTAKLTEKPRDPGNAHFSVDYSDVVSNGNRMRTIITSPKTPGKHTAIFFIQGYSPISYDYTLGGAGLDAPILTELANSDFVTLRVDKPGVGDSEGGPFADIDYTTELDIYRQALKQLKSLPNVDPDNVFIFGHSMGGAFGPMVAAENPVKGMVMYGIAARTWHEYLLDITRYQGLLAGESFSVVDEKVRKSAKMFALAFEDYIAPDQIVKDHPELKDVVAETFQNGLFNAKTAKFWGQLEATNFASYWAKCNSHVLAVWGESDFVTYKVDHQLVADIVNSVHPGWGKVATIPHSDHLFSNWPTQADSLKNFGGGPFNTAFIPLMKNWIKDVQAGKA